MSVITPLLITPELSEQFKSSIVDVCQLVSDNQTAYTECLSFAVDADDHDAVLLALDIINKDDIEGRPRLYSGSRDLIPGDALKVYDGENETMWIITSTGYVIC